MGNVIYYDKERVVILLDRVNEAEKKVEKRKEELLELIKELNILLKNSGLFFNIVDIDNLLSDTIININEIKKSIINDKDSLEKFDSTENNVPNNRINNINNTPIASVTYPKLSDNLEPEENGIRFSKIRKKKDNNVKNLNKKKIKSKEDIDPSTIKIDINKYPKEKTFKAGLKRAVLAAKYLMKKGGFTAEQAAGLVGVFLDENLCDPSAICYDGGMGIQSWTGNVKNLAMKSYGTNKSISTLNLKEQLDMLISTAKPGEFMSPYYNALKRCESVEDASATAIVLTGGVGFSNNWSTHPTVGDARNCLNAYIKSNGASQYTLNAFDRRMDYGKKILKLIK